MRDFRLKTMQLYLKIAKEEVDSQDERLQKLLNEFPPETNDHEPFASKVVANGINDNDDSSGGPASQV